MTTVPNSMAGGVGLFQLLAGGDVDRHALALVAVLGFDHHGQAHFQRHGPGIVHVLDRAAQGHGHPGGVQQALGQVFVLGNGFGHGAGLIDFGCLELAGSCCPSPVAPGCQPSSGGKGCRAQRLR